MSTRGKPMIRRIIVSTALLTAAWATPALAEDPPSRQASSAGNAARNRFVIAQTPSRWLGPTEGPEGRGPSTSSGRDSTPRGNLM